MSTRSKKKNFFITQMFYRLLIPSMFSSLGFALADMADALVLGQKLGATGLAAISLCLPLFMLINFFMDGLGIGGSVHFSQLLGEGNSKGAVQCFNRTWISTLLLGLLIALGVNLFPRQLLSLFGTVPADGALYEACSGYMRIIALGAPLLMLNIVFANFLRNDNNAGLATIGFLIGNIVDIVLNILFVFLFNFGTKGAALATVLGSFVAICIYMPGLVGKKAEILRIRLPRVNMRETLYCFRVGFSTSLQHLFQLVFLLLVNRLLMDIAGEGGVAVFDIVFNMSFFLVYVYNGAAEASQPLVSTFTGENSEDDCRCVLHLSVKNGLGIGAAVAVLLFVFAGGAATAFGISQELMPLAIRAIRIYCVGFAFTGLNILYQNYYQSMEKNRLAFFITLLRGFVILIPCTLLLARLGVAWIWLMFPLTELITLLLFLVYRALRRDDEIEFDPERILRITVGNDTAQIGELLNRSIAFCERWHASEQQKYSTTLVIEEICTSIMRNAMKNLPDGRIRVTVLALEDGDFVLNVLDNAVVFNPFSLKSKKIELEDEFDIDEISMMMIKKKSKKFMYRRCNGFNSLVIRI